MMYRKVLIPLDGSQEAEKVLPIIKNILAPWAEVILLHVISEEGERSETTEYLRDVTSRLCGDLTQCRIEVAVSKSVSQGILDLARQEGADLIAMYTHDRKGLGKLLQRSIARDVRLGATTEVKVFKPQELAEPLPASVRSEGSSLARGLLKETDVFKDLSEDQIDKVVALTQRSRVAAGQGLARAGEVGECLFIIISGDAQLAAHSAVGEITVRIAGPGESFPLAALVGSGTLITSAKALTDMELLVVPRSLLLELCTAEPEIGLRIYSAIAELFANRYSKTLGHLSVSFQERVLKGADFLANV